MSTLKNDDFNDNSRDVTFWNTLIAGTGAVAEQNQLLECFVNLDDVAGYSTIVPYDLSTCDISVRATHPAVNPADAIILQIYIDDNNWYLIQKTRPPFSQWQIQKMVLGVFTQIYGAYEADDSIIKITIGAGTISFYENEILRYSEAYALSSHNCYVRLICSEWVGPTVARMSWFDDFQAIKSVLPPPPPTYTLSIGSNIMGTPLKVRGVSGELSYVTPAALILDEGMYEVEVPATVAVSSDTYAFSAWEDGSLNPTRTILFNADRLIAAAYSLVPPLPPTPKYILSIYSSITGVEVKIRGGEITSTEISGVTPWSGELDEGVYTIEAPDIVTDTLLPSNEYYKFKSWEDGSTNRIRQIDLTSDMTISFELELVSTPLIAPTVNVPLVIGSTVAGGTVGFLIGKVPGSIVGGIAGLIATYVPTLVSVSTTQCINCGRTFKFSTYNIEVWCPYCHRGQVVKKELRRG